MLFQGRIVEQGSPLTLFSNAAHPYTRALLAAVPRMEPRRQDEARLRTVAVAPRPQRPEACPYAHRCPHVQPQCEASRPELLPLASGHLVACHLPQAGPA